VTETQCFCRLSGNRVPAHHRVLFPVSRALLYCCRRFCLPARRSVFGLIHFPALHFYHRFSFPAEILAPAPRGLVVRADFHRSTRFVRQLFFCFTGWARPGTGLLEFSSPRCCSGLLFPLVRPEVLIAAGAPAHGPSRCLP
jgi:hypothetical protein